MVCQTGSHTSPQNSCAKKPELHAPLVSPHPGGDESVSRSHLSSPAPTPEWVALSGSTSWEVWNLFLSWFHALLSFPYIKPPGKSQECAQLHESFYWCSCAAARPNPRSQSRMSRLCRDGKSGEALVQAHFDNGFAVNSIPQENG